MKGLVRLETPRLILRQWRDSDRAPFAVLNSDPDVMEFFPSCLTRERSDNLVDRFSDYINQNGFGFWAVELKEEKRFIGFTGLMELNPTLAAIEIGWRFAKAYWRNGYAYEAASASMTFGFEELMLDRIVAITTLKNIKSQNLMEKLGMVRQSELFAHPSVEDGNPMKMHCVYALPPSMTGLPNH